MNRRVEIPTEMECTSSARRLWRFKLDLWGFSLDFTRALRARYGPRCGARINSRGALAQCDSSQLHQLIATVPRFCIVEVGGDDAPPIKRMGLKSVKRIVVDKLLYGILRRQEMGRGLQS